MTKNAFKKYDCLNMIVLLKLYHVKILYSNIFNAYNFK